MEQRITSCYTRKNYSLRSLITGEQSAMFERRGILKASDWILIVSAAIVVLGWFVNNELNRRHEVAVRKMEHRIETLEEYISFYIGAQKTKSLDGFNDVQVSFYLYGYKDEIDLVESIAKTVTNDRNNPDWLRKMHELNLLVRNRLREELRLPKIVDNQRHN